MRLKAPETVTFTKSGFCPGCGHGLAVRLIAETAEKMGLNEKLITVVDVACGSLNINSWKFDTIMAAHGRPIPTAIGIKKVRPENPVLAYIGDGAAYAIGMAEMMHAGIRNDNILTVVINNGLFGMTGGQCAPTSLSGLHIAYLARGSLADAKGIRISKKYIETAFEKHMAGEGFCLVELLSPCPTNMNMAPVKCVQRINEEMIPYFPLGELKK